MNSFRVLFSLGLVSIVITACGPDQPDSTRGLNGLNDLKAKVSELDQSCQMDSDCSIVTDDFACRKSYVTISKSALSEYQALAKKAESFNKNVGCTMEYSDRYNPDNYSVSCSATNSCQIEFHPPSSGF